MRQMRNILTPEPVPLTRSREDDTTLVDDVMNACCDDLVEIFDEKYGGFDEGSKFPRTSGLKLIMRQIFRLGDESDKDSLAYLLKVLLYTLGALQDGGMHDHVGGGFHRFTVDRVWHVPHFEKMLVDNAQIVQCLMSAAQLIPQEDYYSTTRSTLDYLIREMQSPEGGFYTSQDADSFDSDAHSVTEGAFYIWRAAEIESALTKKEYKIFRDYYNVMKEGNCNLSKTKDDPERLTNVLVIQERLGELATEHKMEESEMKQILSACRKKLYEKRDQREKPARDEKIVCGYNGLAISAFAEASRVLHKEENKSTEEAFPDSRRDPSEYLAVAVQIAEFIVEHLWDKKEGTLKRFYVNGKSSFPAYAEDYGLVIAGFLDLYTCSGDYRWLERAIELQDRMNALFWDSAYGGYYTTTEGSQSTPFRIRICFDTEEPSASSVALSNVLRLSGLVKQKEKYEVRAKEILEAFSSYFDEQAMSLPEFAASACLADTHPSLLKIAIVGDFKNEETQAYMNALHTHFAPSKSLIAVDVTDVDNIKFWKEHAADLMDDLTEVVGPFKTTKKRSKKSKESTDTQPPAVFIYENYRRIGPLESPEILAEYMQFGGHQNLVPLKEETHSEEGVIDVESQSLNI